MERLCAAWTLSCYTGIEWRHYIRQLLLKCCRGGNCRVRNWCIFPLSPCHSQDHSHRSCMADWQ